MEPSAFAPAEMLRTSRPRARSSLNQVSRMFRAMGDDKRLEILLLLSEKEMHVSAICEAMELNQPAVSHHLTQLRNADLVECHRRGKFKFYRVAADSLNETLRSVFPDPIEVSARDE